MKMSMFRRILFVTFMTIAAIQFARADSPTVTAVLSNSDVAVGQMVQMAIKVTGVNNVNAPQEIAVDGLEIHPTGTSRQFEMHNLTTSSSITYNYTILPLKAGRFKIPPQPIQAGSTRCEHPS